MPFCTECGKQVADSDIYCGACGKRQAVPAAPGSPPQPNWPPAGPAPDPLAGLSPRTAAILCYIPAVGWIAAVIVLIARKFKGDRIARFHAFQGLYLFAAWLLVDWFIHPVMQAMPDHFVPIDHIFKGILLVVSIVMMVKASHGEAYVLPIIGELAQKSAAEQ